MANTGKRLFLKNFILKCTIQFILIKALRVLKSLERRKIPVQKWNTMYILACSYQYLSPRFFKKSVGDIAIASVRPSVCLSVRLTHYPLLNHWTKFNQIWCVSCSHEWGVQRHIFLPHPLGPWGEVKYN